MESKWTFFFLLCCLQFKITCMCAQFNFSPLKAMVYILKKRSIMKWSFEVIREMISKILPYITKLYKWRQSCKEEEYLLVHHAQVATRSVHLMCFHILESTCSKTHTREKLCYARNIWAIKHEVNHKQLQGTCSTCYFSFYTIDTGEKLWYARSPSLMLLLNFKHAEAFGLIKLSALD